MAAKYSDRLCHFIGQVELDAFSSGDSFRRYMAYSAAFDSLNRAGLDMDDAKTAREYLSIRARQFKPGNLGIASGEAGEAD